MANKKGAVKPGSSREEVEQRIAHMRRLIVTCEWNERTRHKLSEKLSRQWNVSARMIRDYAHRARRDVDAATHVDTKELDALRQIAVLRTEFILSVALKSKAMMAAVAAHELWCKITGVDELARRRDQRDAEKHGREMQGPSGDGISLEDVQRAEIAVAANEKESDGPA